MFVSPTSLSCSLRSFNGRSLLLFAMLISVCLAPCVTLAEEAGQDEAHWSLKPVVHGDIPTIGDDAERNPIDAFLALTHKEHGLAPLPRASKLTLLRRVSLDLIGLPPTIEQQEAFLNDDSESAYENVVKRLLDSPQHGVRYARHWLDVLRYSDVDDRMPAGDNLYLWRDWVINAINEDVGYDEFVRAQITGYRDTERTAISATGFRRRKEPRPDDVFAMGLLSRGATSRSNKDEALALNAVETISTAFMGMTVGCAKCHDHFYDPIDQEDFYAMKALFDPLELRTVQLATATDVLKYGQQRTAYDREKKRLDDEITEVTRTYHDRLYNERVDMLPPEIQTIIRIPEKERTVEQQKTADEYFPVLRIDSGKLRAIMPREVKDEYDRLRKELGKLDRPGQLPVFYTVGEDEIRKQQTRYVLNSGDATRPEKDRPVQAGFPFADSDSIQFREGLREGFVDWLTASENPLFARVAVNRIWQWHFGQGLHQTPSDFGELGEQPIHPQLLDWLSAEFVARGYSMKWLHRTIVTSDAYMRASSTTACTTEDESELAKLQVGNVAIDPNNKLFWKFPIQRLAAEPIWDAIHAAADDLDLAVGGESFQPSKRDSFLAKPKRRAAYMRRGFRVGDEIMPEFLRVFDVEDGRVPCSRREQTITAPQSLLLMNSPLLENAASLLAEKIKKQTDGELSAAVVQAYRLTLCRPPTATEAKAAMSYLSGDEGKLRSLCWLMFNLDEFIYVP